MIIRNEYLIKLNNKNRVQIVQIMLDYNDYGKVYSIYRITSQFGGKQSEQPLITINKGKAARTVEEQAGLQYASHLKHYLNAGYKQFSLLSNKIFTDLSEEELKNILGGNFNTDTKGIPKPMLAKSYDLCSTNVFEKDVYASRKLDGIRALFYCKDGIIFTASRGGKDYNCSTQHLRNDPMLQALFKAYPDMILDGELYKHGWSLQKISGLCRLQTPTDECEQLEYWIYDYISEEPFEQRYETLNTMSELFAENSKIKIVEHIKTAGWLKVKRLQDQFVREGFEGLCARVPDKPYGVGKRSANYLIKLKDYQDAEFKIIGIKEGLRPEDMCFVMETDLGKQFTAKPACDAQTRIYYLNNPELYIGKYGTCKFFYYSEDKIPLQPVFKNVREEDE